MEIKRIDEERREEERRLKEGKERSEEGREKITGKNTRSQIES